MKDYYDELPSLKIYTNENSKLGKGQIVYGNCEYMVTGDFLILMQRKVKYVMPLVGIDHIEYPYEENP